MKNPLPTALAVPLLLFAGATFAASAQPAAHGSAIASQSGAAHASAALPQPQRRRLDLSTPNFTSPQWQRRLQGPTIDREYTPIESVVVTPSREGKSNLTVAPAGVGSIYWALTHPADSWRILLPSQPGDEFNTQREIALAYNDPLSDCPGFPGPPNVRPQCN